MRVRVTVLAWLAGAVEATEWSFTDNAESAIGNPQFGLYSEGKWYNQFYYPPDPFSVGSCGFCKGGRGGCTRCTNPPHESAPAMPEWADDTMERVRFEYKDLCLTDADSCDMSKVNDSLTNVARRGRQAILTFRSARSDRSANDTKYYSMPQWMQPNIQLCKYYDGESTRWQPSWNDNTLITAFEKLIAALSVFDGDPRLLWVEAGLLGNDGTWLLSTHGKDVTVCPGPSDATQKRIMDAYKTHLPRTFILLPDARLLGGADLAQYPMFGFHDWNFGANTFAGNNFTGVVAANPTLADRWRTAPVSGSIAKVLKRCWFSGSDFVSECANVGAMLSAPSVTSCVEATHSTAIQYQFNLFQDKPVKTKQGVYPLQTLSAEQAAAQGRMKQAYVQFGPRFTLRAAAAEGVTGGQLRLCVEAENAGSAPFYAPDSTGAPKIHARLHKEQGEMAAAPLGTQFGSLMPGEGSAVYTANMNWGALDECSGNTVCTAAGQTCEDPDKTHRSQGDWQCVCPGGAIKERGRAAVCQATTWERDDEVVFDQAGQDSQVFPTKMCKELGLTGQSFSISFWMYLNTINKADKGAREDTSSIFSYYGDYMAVMGVDSKLTKLNQFAVLYRSRQIRLNFGSRDCSAGTPTPSLFGSIDNHWVHITVVYDQAAQKQRIYYDGVLVKECDRTEALLDEAMVNVGAYSRSDAKSTQDKKGLLFFGRLKQIRIYGGHAVTDEEAMRLATPRAVLRSPPTIEVFMTTTFAQRDMYFSISDLVQSDTRPKTVLQEADCCGCTSCYQYFVDNREMCTFYKLKYNTEFDATCGLQDTCGRCGVVRLPLPSSDVPAQTNTGCFGPRTDSPTVADTPVPTADTENCAELTLTGFNLTVPGVTHTDSDCDGAYSRVGVAHWVHSGGIRELWRLADGTYRCVGAGGGPDSAHFGRIDDAGWWADHVSCTQFITSSPTAKPTPLPPGSTFVPDTAAPDTPAPDTTAPASPAPGTPAPPTPAPQTDAPESPAPQTPAPPTPAPTPLPPGATAHPSVGPTPPPPSAGPTAGPAAAGTPSASPAAGSAAAPTAGPSGVAVAGTPTSSPLRPGAPLPTVSPSGAAAGSPTGSPASGSAGSPTASPRSGSGTSPPSAPAGQGTRTPTTEEEYQQRGAAGGDKVTTTEDIPVWFWILIVVAVLCLGVCGYAWYRAYKKRNVHMRKQVRAFDQGWDAPQGQSPQPSPVAGRYAEMQKPVLPSSPVAAQAADSVASASANPQIFSL